MDLILLWLTILRMLTFFLTLNIHDDLVSERGGLSATQQHIAGELLGPQVVFYRANVVFVLVGQSAHVPHFESF